MFKFALLSLAVCGLASSQLYTAQCEIGTANVGDPYVRIDLSQTKDAETGTVSNLVFDRAYQSLPPTTEYSLEVCLNLNPALCCADIVDRNYRNRHPVATFWTNKEGKANKLNIP